MLELVSGGSVMNRTYPVKFFNRLIKIYVTIAANLEKYSISNPGPLEQKTRQKQGLNVFLHESFCDG